MSPSTVDCLDHPSPPISHLPESLSSAHSPPLDILSNFLYSHDFDHGTLEIRLMSHEDHEHAIELLTQSFIESLRMQGRHRDAVEFCVRDYINERPSLVPHAAVLVGFYKERGQGGEVVFAGTVEMSFDETGVGGPLPTPEPPRGCPYVCNMTVKKGLRRKGIGWHLLKACEQLVDKMGRSTSVYLHCRMVDKGALALYKKAGYQIYRTDSKLLWFVFKRRKHLLRKDLSLGDSHGPGFDYHSGFLRQGFTLYAAFVQFLKKTIPFGCCFFASNS